MQRLVYTSGTVSASRCDALWHRISQLPPEVIAYYKEPQAACVIGLHSLGSSLLLSYDVYAPLFLPSFSRTHSLTLAYAQLHQRHPPPHLPLPPRPRSCAQPLPSQHRPPRDLRHAPHDSLLRHQHHRPHGSARPRAWVDLSCFMWCGHHCERFSAVLGNFRELVEA